MAKTVSIKNICEFFWKQEKELELLKQKSGDVFYWRLIRFKVFHEISQKTGIFGVPHPKNKKQAKVSFFSFWQLLKGSFFRNPFLNWGAIDTVVMPHTRNLRGKDIYIESILRELPPQKTMILYKDWRGQCYKNAKTMDFATAVFYFVSKARSFLSSRCSDSKMAGLIQDLEKRIKEKFDVDVGITRLARQHILYFRIKYFFYCLLFRIKRVKTMYVVTAYIHFPAVAAAKDCGIKVIELQHGIFTRYHLGYSFPVDGEHVPYTPNEIRCFGKFWPDATPLPKNMNPVISGFPYLTRMLEKTIGTEKTPGQVMVPSQGPVAKILFPFAVKMARKMPKKTFIYRLHPSEELSYFEEKIETINVPKNFRISSSDMPEEPTTYELMAQSTYQIGVSSTTLLEGIFLGCKTGILNMPGSEYMDHVVERGDAFSADTVEDVSARIDQPLPSVPDPFYYYADKNLERRLKGNVSRSIAIGIISYKRPEGLERLLVSLAEQKLEARFSQYCMRIIVVDNDCTGDNGLIVDNIKARYGLDIEFIEESRPGIPHARNASVAAAINDDAMIFVDDDEFAPVNWLNNMIQGWEETNGDVITGPVMGILPEDAPTWALKSRIYNKTYPYNSGQRIGRAFTNNTLVTQRVLKDMGASFDNKFQYTGSSDVHYFMRVNKKGYRIIWWPDAPIKETVPYERIKIVWLIKRGFRTGAGDTVIRLMISNKQKILFKIFYSSSLRIAAGGAQIILSPLGGGWRFFIVGIRRAASGIGGILGVFNVVYCEYKRDK